MRSEKEIQKIIEYLKYAEEQSVEEMKECIAEAPNFLDIYITKANNFQYQRTALEWVLNDSADDDWSKIARSFENESQS